MENLVERLAKVEERSKSNTKRIDTLEEKTKENERVLNNVDKSLTVTVEQETVIKDANNWRNSKSKIASWILTGILAIVASALGISKFF